MAEKPGPQQHDQVWGVHALPDNIPLWDSPNYWENTCRVLPPSDAHPKGLIVLLPGQGGDSSYLLKVISRPIYDDDGNVDMRPPPPAPSDTRHDQPSVGPKLFHPSVSSDLPNPGYLNGHTDNQIVRAKDGSLLAVKSCLNWAPVSDPEPWQRICIRDREPDTHVGCRGTEVVWRGSWGPRIAEGKGGILWTLRGLTDPYVLVDGKYGYPRPLGCPDAAHPNGREVASLNDQCTDPPSWTCPNVATKCQQLGADMQALQGQIDDFCDPELIKHSTALAGKCNTWRQQLQQKREQAAAWACDLQGWWTAPGSDRPEVYACPFTGYLYLAASFVSGQFPLPDPTTAARREDVLVLFSKDLGKTWELLKSGQDSPIRWQVPMVMTSTPNGRLFLYHWGRDGEKFYGRLLCSNLFDYENGEAPQITDVIGGDGHVVGDSVNGYQVRYEQSILQYWETVNGKSLKTPMPPDPTMHDNDQTIPHPSISRVSTDTSASKVRVSLIALNQHRRNIYAIIDIGVVDKDHQPSIETGSVRRAGRIEAADPVRHSVLHGTFIDPDYISMPGMASNMSLFYWLEWPRRAETMSSACAAAPNGDLHLLVVDDGGALWHTIRMSDGTWPHHMGNVQAAVPGADPGPMSGVACATAPNGDLHVLAVDRQDRLWHTIRKSGGSWPLPFGDVLAAVPEPLPNAVLQVTCATDPNTGELHVLAIDQQYGLWHTIRMSNGTWPYHFGDVQDAVPGPGPGPTPGVACATAPNGDLHVLATDQQNRLWHTIRMSDGTWPYHFGNVQDAVPGPASGPTHWVACATTSNGDLQVVTTDTNGGLWYTIRNAADGWPYPFADVEAAVPGGGPGPTPWAACATDPTNDNLHLLAIDQQYSLWHTIRMSDGTWPYHFGDVQAAVPSGGAFPNQMSTHYRFFQGSPSQQGRAGALSVQNGAPRTWKGFDPGGDYMSGGFFFYNGLNYLAQWREPDGIKANIVRYVPQPTVKIP